MFWASSSTNNFVQVTLASSHKMLAPFQDGCQEGIMRLHLLAKLFRGIDRGIHFPPEALLRLARPALSATVPGASRMPPPLSRRDHITPGSIGPVFGVPKIPRTNQQVPTKGAVSQPFRVHESLRGSVILKVKACVTDVCGPCLTFPPSAYFRSVLGRQPTCPLVRLHVRLDRRP